MKKTTNKKDQTNTFADTLARLGRLPEPQIEIPDKPCVEAFKPVSGWIAEQALQQTGLHPVVLTEAIHGQWQALAHDGNGKLYFLSQRNCREIDARQSTRLFRFIQETAHCKDFSDDGISVWLTILSQAIAGKKAKKVSIGSIESEVVQESGLSPDLFAADMVERGVTELQFKNY